MSQPASPVTEWHQLRGFQRDCLVAIRRLTVRQSTPYGLAIKCECQALRDGPVNHGQLYPTLDELVDAGYVTKRPLDDRTNCYELTDAGASLLAAQADAFQTFVDDAPAAVTGAGDVE